MTPSFLAIDFETANYQRSSACSIGLVLIQHSKVVAEEHYYIRPPTSTFTNTRIHSISWADVHDAGTMRDVWREIRHLAHEAEFFVAHSAGFDRSVMRATFEHHRMRMPALPFACTCQMAKVQWGLKPAKLPDVCKYLRIRLDNHHTALDDATATARIAVKGIRQGWTPTFLA